MCFLFAIWNRGAEKNPGLLLQCLLTETRRMVLVK